jgi:carboxypeptidase Taq
LQDIHWSIGAFGYFPTYTLGNLNASQLMQRAASDMSGLGSDLRSGNYQRLLGWLRERIHEPGQRHDPQELMRRATGAVTQAKHHLTYLRAKFLRE